MSDLPAYIKVSNKSIKNNWVSENPITVIKLKGLGDTLASVGAGLYLIGSASGREDSTKVDDLDLIIFVSRASDLVKIEYITRKYKQIEGTNLKVRYIFQQKNVVKDYSYSKIYDPEFYTANKVNHYHLGGENIIQKSNWLDEYLVKQTCITNLRFEAMMLFRIVNKQKWNREQVSKLIKEVRGIMFNAMHYLGYFGFSKTEIFKMFLEEYPLRNIKPAQIMYETREKDLNHFYDQDPEEFQNECLKFSQEMLIKFENK